MAGVAAPAGDDALAVEQLRPLKPRFRRPAPVQPTSRQPSRAEQRPGGRVGAQQLQRRTVRSGVGDGGPALHDIGVVPHPVVQGQGEPVHGVGEADPQFVPVRLGGVEGPLGAADLRGAYRECWADEPGAALDRILLPAVEVGLEGPEVQFRGRGQRLGRGEGDPRPPVQMDQLVLLGQPQCVTAARPGEQPGPAGVARLDHRIPTFQQFRTSSTICVVWATVRRGIRRADSPQENRSSPGYRQGKAEMIA